jgi:hypothetical protein
MAVKATIVLHYFDIHQCSSSPRYWVATAPRYVAGRLAPFSPLTPKILIRSANAQAQAGKKGGSHTYETLQTQYDLFGSKSPLFQQPSVEGEG